MVRWLHDEAPPTSASPSWPSSTHGRKEVVQKRVLNETAMLRVSTRRAHGLADLVREKKVHLMVNAPAFHRRGAALCAREDGLFRNSKHRHDRPIFQRSRTCPVQKSCFICSCNACEKVQAAARNTSCSLSYPPRSVAPEVGFLQLVSYESADEAQDTAHPSPGILNDDANTRGRTHARRHHRRDTRKHRPRHLLDSVSLQRNDFL